MEDKQSYYLLDNEVRYYPATQIVKHPDYESHLTDFQHKLLMNFLQNPGLVRTQEEICQQVWPNKITTVDAFNKPLGAIRNALSNNEKTKKNDFIKTWSREGYSLECNCELVSTKKFGPVVERLKLFGSAIIVALIAAIMIAQFYQKPIYDVVNIRRLTPLNGIAAEPSLSDDGKLIAFTFYDRQFNGQILAKKLSAKDHVVLTQGHNDKMPSLSPTGNQVVYQRLEQNQCQIRMLTLTEKLIVSSDELLINCSPTSFFVSMAWHDESSFYYTDSSTAMGPYSIYRFDLKSGLSTLYLSPDVRVEKEHNGFARVVYHRKTQKLYIIHSPDWLNSVIKLYQNEDLTNLINVNTSIGSLGIFNDSAIYKDNSNRLIIGPQKQSLTTEFNRPVLHPVTSQDSNKIAYYIGHIYQWNIYSYKTDNGEIQQLTFDNARNRYPIKTAQHFYYSSDFTGITQIYRQPQDASGQPLQLSNFSTNREITQIAVSGDGQSLAISFGQITEIFAVKDHSLQFRHRFKKGVFPSFSLDSKRILLSVPQTKTSLSVVEYTLADMKPTSITIEDARFALYHKSGFIYAKSSGNGLYLYINGHSQPLNSEIQVFKPAHVALADDYIYVVDRSDKASKHVSKIALDGTSISPLPIKNVGQLHYFEGKLYYTLEQLGESSIYVGDIIER